MNRERVRKVEYYVILRALGQVLNYVVPLLDGFHFDGEMPTSRSREQTSRMASGRLSNEGRASNCCASCSGLGRYTFRWWGAWRWNLALILSRAYANVVINFTFEEYILLLAKCNSLSMDREYHRFDEPVKTEMGRIAGVPSGPEAPSYSVWSARLVIASNKVSDPRILTSDFGEAWLSKKETRESLVTPLIWLAPKDRFPKWLIRFPAEVWTVACTLYEILYGWGLFEVPLGDGDDLVLDMISWLNMLPQQ